MVGGGGRWRDVIAWSGSRGDFELGPLRCRGRAAWMRERADDGPVSLVAFDADEASWTATGAPVALVPGAGSCAVWRADR